MTTNTFEEHLTKGIEAHRAGRIEEALTAYRAAIELQPDDAEAVSLMGLALSQSAWADQALGFLRHAVQLEPEQLPFRMNLVEGLERLGYVEQARAEVRAVIVRDAGHFRAWEKSGDLALRAGDLEAAAAAWTQARVLDPSAPGPALKLAQLALQRGEPAKSLAILDKLAERLPSDAQLLALRAESLAAARRWSDHAACVEQWLRAHPQDPEAYRALARQHFEAGQFREAANAYGRVLALRPPTAADWTSFASLALHALDLPAASAALEQAERLEPQNPQMIATRALLELYAGRFKAAEEDAERCLALDPDNSAAAVVLSRVRRGRLTEREAANLERIAADESAHLDRRIPAAFAIGHALDAQGDWAAALRAYERAHSLAKRRDAAEGRRFDAAALATRRAAILAFDYDIVPRATAATRDPRPVFIVGMPRSGTTLIEAVIAAHPQVLGCGERLAMPPLVDALIGAGDTLTTPRADLARELRRRYLLGLPSLGTANYFTDKQPFNFEAIALIDRLFPDAPIVHVHRDPLETCWSIYRQEFHKAWSFTHEFADIAAVYAHEVELLRAWSQRLPGRVIDIRYEEFVADFPEQARRLIAACGLPWDPACLEFQRNPRPIVTFSAVEAREPVASRNGRAARYGSLLAPLRAALAERGIQ